MIGRRTFVVATLGAAAAPAQAQELKVLDSAPKAHAVIGPRSSGFYVRFNRPVDHQDSRLAIVRDGRVVEVLHPRLESAPEVLFARAPTLPPGNYGLAWRVGGNPQLDGEIPFSVDASR